jgi:hypothetical protein
VHNTVLIARSGVRGHRVPVLAVATLSGATRAHGRTLVGQGRPQPGRGLAVSSRSACCWPRATCSASRWPSCPPHTATTLSLDCPTRCRTAVLLLPLRYRSRLLPPLAPRCATVAHLVVVRTWACPYCRCSALPFMALRLHMSCLTMDARMFLSIASTHVPP